MHENFACKNFSLSQSANLYTFGLLLPPSICNNTSLTWLVSLKGTSFNVEAPKGIHTLIVAAIRLNRLPE